MTKVKKTKHVLKPGIFASYRSSLYNVPNPIPYVVLLNARS